MDYKKSLTRKSIDAIEKEFARLDLDSENSESIGNEIIAMIPWNISLPSIIEEFNHPLFRARARASTNQLNFLKVNSQLEVIKKNKISNYKELSKGIFLISTMENPFLSWQNFSHAIATIADGIKEEFNNHMHTLDNKLKLHIFIKVINESVQVNHQAIGFLNEILDSKKGLPVSMGVLYLLINEKIGLPLYGINFPFHFILHYNSPDFKTYIDPYNSGVFLDKTTCDSYLELNGFDSMKEFYTRASTISILKRIYTNLVHFYRKSGDDNLTAMMTSQLGILNKTDLENNE